MRRLALVALVLVAAGCGTTKTVVRTETRTVTTPGSPLTSGDQWFHVQVHSVERDGGHYLIQVDPSWFLSGIAANVALAQDEHRRCAPDACEPVPNDNHVVDESHRLYTFVLPATTTGTVLMSSGNRRSITAAQLRAIVAGTSPLKLFEPLQSGVWILVHIDTVRTFAQQYVP